MIRRCNATDIPQIYELEVKTFKIDDVYSIELLKFLCSYCFENSYIYIKNNRVIGYVITCIEGDSAHVISIAVDPEYRRQGVGRALLCTALRLLYDGKVSEVFLEVRVSNEPALRLYQDAGFQIYERLKGYYSDGEDGYRLRLRDKTRARSFCSKTMYQ
ncbi:MAG: ribosomal protein S18-alanine N-acetyltransferase [Pyrobaculum sp.]